MQLAIIGSKEEILEVIKYVESMNVTNKSEQVVRAEISIKTDQLVQLHRKDISTDRSEIG